MEYKAAVGWRRSVRFFEPWREVEREKVQAILEAVYRAPRVLEVDFVRTVVVYRDELKPQELQAMKMPTTTAQVDMAPIYIFFYADLEALNRAADGSNYRELMARGVLNPSHGWTETFIEQTVRPYLQAIIDAPDRITMRVRTPDGDIEGPTVSRAHLNLARTAIGIAQEHALLAAFDEGLGAQLSALNTNIANGILGVPPSWTTSSPLLLGYHGESRETGGQRPREPFEEDFFELRYGHPFYREPAVVDRLTAAEMIQPVAPLPWRKDELRALARKFGLPD